jgi:long-chain acyl-CoA synthetase
MTAQKYPVELLLAHALSAPHKTWLVQPADGRTRRWTWAQALKEVAGMAAALKAQNWPAGSRIAISGRNTAHWFLADLAIQWAGHVPVGLYPKQADKATTYILEHCEAKALFLGPMPDGVEFLQSIPKGVTTIRFPYAEAPHGELEWDVLAQAHAPLSDYERPAPDALMTLIYTSGTTGNPKGVMMNYGAIAWVAEAFLDKLPPAGADERLFSYLPLAHLMERAAVEIASLLWCAEVHFLEALDKLAQQLPQVAPTRFFAVPLVWTRFQAGIHKQLPPARLKRLMAVPLLRGLLRRKLLKALGLQNVRMAVSGAAPIPKTTLEWFQQILGLEILEGYGMTENGAYVSVSLPGQIRVGTVGKPFADTGFRLSDDGEIQVKHPGNMSGYYKEPEQTTAAFTDDGWLRTGDKGRLDADGFLSITGRVKDIFKTAKGKYVAPAPIEAALARNADIDQLCMVGMNLTQPIMVVTLTPDAQRKLRAVLESTLVADMESVNAVLEDHEKIAKLLIASETWTIDNGFMTPTMKVKRNVVEERYNMLIEEEAQNRKSVVVWGRTTTSV